MKKQIVMTALLALAASLAQAQVMPSHWEFVGKDSNGARYFVDTANIARAAQGVSFRERRAYPYQTSYTLVFQSYRINCGQPGFQTDWADIMGAKGKMIYFSMDMHRSRIAPTTAARQYVCSSAS